MLALGALVNNAGDFPEGVSDPVEKLPLDYFEEVFAVNVVGGARVTQMFSPLLTQARIRG